MARTSAFAVPGAAAPDSEERPRRLRWLGAGALLLRLLRPVALGRRRGLHHVQEREIVPLPRGHRRGGGGGARWAPQSPWADLRLPPVRATHLQLQRLRREVDLWAVPGMGQERTQKPRQH